MGRTGVSVAVRGARCGCGDQTSQDRPATQARCYGTTAPQPERPLTDRVSVSATIALDAVAGKARPSATLTDIATPIVTSRCDGPPLFRAATKTTHSKNKPLVAVRLIKPDKSLTVLASKFFIPHAATKE